jgi:polygalacturonase
MPQSTFNARDFGAIGNGKELDSSAIQMAIEACAAAGGGKVLLPAGNYLCGTLFLRDFVTLHLAEGCVLITCADVAQFPENIFYEGLPRYQHNCRALIYAEGVRHCGVSGNGVINGQDQLFWDPIPLEDQRPSAVHFRKKDWRPFTIAFNRCEHVHVEDVTIEKSSAYAAWIVECNYVRLQNITVDHDFFGPNTDGFHLSSCHNAFISGCSFYAGDDCIAIDGNGSAGSNGIVISDCVFETLTNAVRLFTNLDPVRDESAAIPWCAVKNVTIQNCVVKNAGSVLNVVANNGTISNVVMSGISITQQLPGTTIFLLTQNGKISNVDISHIVATVNGAAALMGDVPGAIDGVSLSHCRFEIEPLRKEWESGFPANIAQYTVYHQAPWMLHFRHIQQLSLDHLHVQWNSDSIAAPPVWNYEDIGDLQESFLTDRS